MPGARLSPTNGKSRQLPVEVSGASHYPLNRIEIVHNGYVTGSHTLINGNQQRDGTHTLDLKINSDGWIAARAYGAARDSYAQAVYAHTSPVYIGSGIPAKVVNDSAKFFVCSIGLVDSHKINSGKRYCISLTKVEKSMPIWQSLVKSDHLLANVGPNDQLRGLGIKDKLLEHQKRG